jgi:diacylglycerol kinase (ATP)
MAPRKGLFDLRRIARAAGYSAAGLKAAVRGETAFRQELALCVVLAPLGLWLGRDGVERALLLGSLLLVLVIELLNSAIEAAINRIGAERNELSGLAKDLGSAAVFVALLIVLTVWGLVLADRF